MAEDLPSDKQGKDQDTGLGEAISRATIQLDAYGLLRLEAMVAEGRVRAG